MALRWCFKPKRISLTKKIIPKRIPIPKTNKIGTTEKSSVKKDLIAPMMGIYRPKTSSKVDPDIPGRTMAVMAILAAMKT